MAADPPHLSRRFFLTTTAAAGLGALGCDEEALAPHPPARALSPAAVAPGPAGFDLTRFSGALEPDAVVHSGCQFCNSNCRLLVHKKAGRIIDIRGEPGDPVQAGNLCVKGPMMAELLYNLFGPQQRLAEEMGLPLYEPANTLVDDRQFDTLSGQQAYKCFACRVRRAS